MSSRIDLPLFLLALAIALAIKFTVHEVEQLSERVIEAQVIYNAPAPELISYDKVEKVRIGVRGKSTEIGQLSPFNVEAVADIPKGRPGPTDINLTNTDVLFRIPGRFEVISIEPNRFTIQVEPRLQKTVPVYAQLTGEPAAGARHGEPVVRPSLAEISGPESKVRAVTGLSAPVSLEGHARTFEQTVAPASPDPLVQIVRPSRVVVEVPMQEPELSISFEDLREGP